MAEAYKNKLRIRIENLVGPKRKVDITSCAFMKDLAQELQKEFKTDMQRLFRIRESAQANRDRLSHKEEERSEEKPFFREDSDDEWCPYYSEESDEDVSSSESLSDEEAEVQRKVKEGKRTAVKVKTEEEKEDEVSEDAKWTEDGALQKDEIKDEVSPELLQAEPSSEKVKGEQLETASLDEEKDEEADLEEKLDERLEEYEEPAEPHEAPLTGEKKYGRKKTEDDDISIFSYEEVFEGYKAPIVEQMEQEESIDALFALSEMSIRTEKEASLAEYEYHEEPEEIEEQHQENSISE